MKKYIVYSDGGSRGNPGPAAIGAVVYDANMNVLREISEYIGKTTNNQAEYQAIFAAIQECAQRGAQEVSCFLDSQLIVRQMNGLYRVRDQGLFVWYEKIQRLIAAIGNVHFTFRAGKTKRQIVW